MKDILYSVARDGQGILAYAGTAPKGSPYYCPGCGGKFILKRSKRRIKRPHFAHKNPSVYCSPENALHNLFQNELFADIENSLARGSPLPIEWQCSLCEEIHKGNLLKKITHARKEYDLKECVPDIALLGTDNKVHSVIEIILSHPPEENALRYYDTNDIILIKFILNSDNDIDRLRDSPLGPDDINTCLNQRCGKCDQYMLKVYIHIIDGDCWKCLSPMKVAAKGSIYYLLGGPASFTPGEISLARRHGVLITYRYSDTVKKRYMANICPKCNGFIGEFFLGPNYFMPSILGDYRRDSIEIGYCCPFCFHNNEN